VDVNGKSNKTLIVINSKTWNSDYIKIYNDILNRTIKHGDVFNIYNSRLISCVSWATSVCLFVFISDIIVHIENVIKLIGLFEVFDAIARQTVQLHKKYTLIRVKMPEFWYWSNEELVIVPWYSYIYAFDRCNFVMLYCLSDVFFWYNVRKLHPSVRPAVVCKIPYHKSTWCRSSCYQGGVD